MGFSYIWLIFMFPTMLFFHMVSLWSTVYSSTSPIPKNNPQLKKFLFILLSIHIFKWIVLRGFLSVLAIWKWPSWYVILSFLQEGNSCRKGTVGCSGQGTLVLCKHKEHHLYFIIVIFYCFILIIYYLFYYLQATGSFRSFFYPICKPFCK